VWLDPTLPRLDEAGHVVTHRIAVAPKKPTKDTDERVMAAMAEVRRVREAGALQSLSMFEVERVLQRGGS
jgi:hypothetical protein